MAEGSEGGDGEDSNSYGEEVADTEAESNEGDDSPDLEEITRAEEPIRKEIIRVLREEGIEGVEKLSLEQLIDIAKKLETRKEERKEIWYDQFIERLNPSIRWAFYILRAITDNDKVDVYKEIIKADSKIALLLPGRLGIPYKNRFKGNIIRVGTEDPDEIQKIVEFIKYVKGQKPNIITYSKGSLTARRYIKQYGNEALGKIIALAPIVEIPGAHHVHAENDRVIPFMNSLRRIIPTKSNKEILTNPPPKDKILPKLGHVDFAYNPIIIDYVDLYFNPKN